MSVTTEVLLTTVSEPSWLQRRLAIVNETKMPPRCCQCRGRHVGFGVLRHGGFLGYNSTLNAEPLNYWLDPIFLIEDLCSVWKERMLWYRKLEPRMGAFLQVPACSGSKAPSSPARHCTVHKYVQEVHVGPKQTPRQGCGAWVV